MTPQAKRASSSLTAWSGRGICALLAAGILAGAANAAPPEIRTSTQNVVPACVTPQRLMGFLKSRNHNVDPRFKDIAKFYKRHGEKWRVRWDYAFFQMAVETNFLSFKQGNGRWGDVNPRQNNFAGLGTTGGGVAGDSYPDVNTGVLAQIQHLVAYSGERVANPVGARTKLKQDDIIQSMAHLNGRTTFSDLSHRWAVDRHYGAAIEWVAGSYRAAHCKGGAEKAEAAEKTDVAEEVAASVIKTEPRRAEALAPAEALGGPEVVAESPPAPAPVRTIWSRDAQQGPAMAPANSPAPAATATHAAAAKPDPDSGARVSPTTDTAKPPVPVAKAAAAQTPPLAVASIAQPEPAGMNRSQQTAGAPTPAVIALPVSPAIEDEPAVAPAMMVPAPVHAFSFAPALNLAALTTSPEPKPVAAAGPCRVLSASYGGSKTLLVRAQAGAEVNYTALTVLDGFEGSMLDNFVKAHAPGGSSIGAYETRDAALAKAKELCPGAAEVPRAEGASAG